ncbi:uncharacterized protein LOC132756766 [Ruditapes philippinarum]|uniref:uncharacterized protein LOC132756766 n=1 Tax=Ruditapes philippinarum TaxID=129788 RepID=UPI00295A5B6A|nr:uncharacterized protein LOC132756766 [Ruditapes philippinarum]
MSMNLFWMDNINGVIGRINIDTRVKTKLGSIQRKYHYGLTYGMTLVGDKLYFPEGNHVSRLSVDDGELDQVGPSNFSWLTGITSYKKTDIKTVFSKCLQSTCSHLCLPVSGKDYKCACSDGDTTALNPCRETNVRRCLSDTDYMHIQWDTGIPGRTSKHKCPTGYRGNVTRYCTITGIYQDPVYNCTKISIENIYQKLINATKTCQVNLVDVLDELSKLRTSGHSRRIVHF